MTYCLCNGRILIRGDYSFLNAKLYFNEHFKGNARNHVISKPYEGMGQIGGFTDAQTQMSKKKKKDNYSLAKLFLMRMSLRLLLKKTPTKQQSRQKFVKSHFPQRLKDKFHFESDIRNLKLKRQHGKILPNKSKHLSFCRALGVSVHRFLTGNSVCALDQVLFF